MTFRRLVAIAIIFLGASAAWSILGTSLVARSGASNQQLEQEVQLLWGTPHRQIAPAAYILRPGVETETVETKDAAGRTSHTETTKAVMRTAAAPLEATNATVDLDLEHRRRGLLWYPTYAVTFQGTYTFRNPDAETRTMHVSLSLPAKDALFDDFVFTVNGTTAVPAGDISKQMKATVTAPPGATLTVNVHYRSRGLRTWTYAFTDSGVAEIRNFMLSMRTNFRDVDFPPGSVSPGRKVDRPGGWTLTWNFSNLISGQSVGIVMPQKLNPGPFAARVTFFAPVSLLFFLSVMVIVGATHGPSLHPMHYWFIAAAFFAFHLLLAYLVDHISVHLAFAIAALVSLALVVSYLRVVTGMAQALLVAGSAQAVFLVLFSYAFFFEGFTGLSITIGAIITLFVLMQMTARVSWDAVFSDHTPTSNAGVR